MSEARWCDFGNHAYKGGREGTIMMGKLEKAQGPGNSYPGQTPNITQQVLEMCPECAAEQGFITDYEAPIAPRERRAAILGQLESEGHVAK